MKIKWRDDYWWKKPELIKLSDNIQGARWAIRDYSNNSTLGCDTYTRSPGMVLTFKSHEASYRHRIYSYGKITNDADTNTTYSLHSLSDTIEFQLHLATIETEGKCFTDVECSWFDRPNPVSTISMSLFQGEANEGEYDFHCVSNRHDDNSELDYFHFLAIVSKETFQRCTRGIESGRLNLVITTVDPSGVFMPLDFDQKKPAKKITVKFLEDSCSSRYQDLYRSLDLSELALRTEREFQPLGQFDKVDFDFIVSTSS